MKHQYIVSLLFLSMLLTSCYSYKVMPKELRHTAVQKNREKAYVINKDDFKKEYRILSKSKIFELSDDASTPLKIKLKATPNELYGPSCGTGQATVLILFIGQLPVHYQDGAKFGFDEIRNLEVTKREFTIDMRRRVWFYDMFLFGQNRSNKIANGLRGYYQAQQ